MIVRPSHIIFVREKFFFIFYNTDVTGVDESERHFEQESLQKYESK